MQRRASSSHGPTMAWVGHTSIQAVQLPQCSVAGASAGSGRSVYSSPRKNQEPARRWIRLVCLPIQPKPALRASAFSSTGALSTKGPITEVANARLDPLGQLLQPATQHLVIIAAEGIAGDKAEFGIVDHLTRHRARAGAGSPCARRSRTRCRDAARGAAATLAVACHIVHVAVAAGVQPALQARLVLAQVRAGDADLLKAQLPAPGLDLDGEISSRGSAGASFTGLRRVLACGVSERRAWVVVSRQV